jgi:hypothetical protein
MRTLYSLAKNNEPNPKNEQYSAKINRTSDKLRVGRVVLLVSCLAAIHAFRYWGHFRNPILFCEEGTVFLAGRLAGDWPFISAGYLNLFSASLIHLLSELTIIHLPLITSLIAAVFSTLTFCYLLLPRWEKLLEFRYRLFLVVFFLGFSPYDEGIGILLYSFWYFGIGTALIVLELLYLPEFAQRSRVPKALYVLVGGLSGIATLQVALSLLVIHFVMDLLTMPARVAIRNKISLAREPVLVALIFAGLTQAIVLYTHGEGRPYPPIATMLQLPLATINQTNMRVTAPTFFSNRLTPIISSSQILSWLTLGFTFVLFALLFFQRNTIKRRLSWELAGAGMFSTWILYLGRTEIFDYFRFHVHDIPLNAIRYSLIPGFFFLTALTITLSNLRNSLVQNIFVSALVPLIAMAGALNYSSREPVSDTWPETARQIMELKQGVRQSIDRPLIPTQCRLYVGH